jgi:hypothetical protein
MLRVCTPQNAVENAEPGPRIPDYGRRRTACRELTDSNQRKREQHLPSVNQPTTCVPNGSPFFAWSEATLDLVTIMASATRPT